MRETTLIVLIELTHPVAVDVVDTFDDENR